MSDRTKSYVSMALFARETARRYRNLKRKYPAPEHADFLEREARASYRCAMFWVDRARIARCAAMVAACTCQEMVAQAAALRSELMPSAIGSV